MTKDPDAPLRTLLFGDGLRKVNFNVLSGRTGIPSRTLRTWGDKPSKITVGNLRKIAKAQGIPWENVGKAIGGEW